MVVLDHVSKRYADGQPAVEDLSLAFDQGQICVLLGPSGCGKSTTLRMVNRMVEPTSGIVMFNGQDVRSIDPVALRLRMGYVIQQVGLFPHLTVAGNVGVVPRLLRWPPARVEQRVREMLELVGLDRARHGHRYPNQLSGGQQQRVGVARALAGDPPVMLMDEPFGAIDRITRERLQNEFLDIQERMRKTIIFVTHDIDEACKMGNRIAVLSEHGVLEQHDSPERLLAQPATEFVRRFLGSTDKKVR